MPHSLSIIVCRDRIQRPEQEALAAALTTALERRPEFDVVVLPHLVDLAPDGLGMALLRSIGGPMVVLARLYPRAAFWVLDANGVRGRMGGTDSAATGTTPMRSAITASAATGRGFTRGPDRAIWCMDLRQYVQPEPILAEIERIAASAATAVSPVAGGMASSPSPFLAEDMPTLREGMPPTDEMSVPPGEARVVDEAIRDRWYPVIDFDRCTNCLECLNFCLFGVYSLDDEDAILVEQPDACRNGCPACSRVCPQGAIMFPQHKDPGIAGDPEAASGGMRLDFAPLFGGNESSQLAVAERDRALAQGNDELARLVDRVDELEL